MPADLPRDQSVTALSAAGLHFIEVQTRLDLAKAERERSAARYALVEREFHNAWANLPAAEQQAINAAYAALNEPESVCR